jgi:hypothetical protein
VAQLSLQEINNQLEMQRSEAIARMQQTMRRDDKTWELGVMDERRAAETAKVDAAMTGLIGKKFAASDAGIAGADQPMTQAQLDSIQMAKDADRFDPSMRAQALASSGVIDQKDAVGLLSGVEEKSYKRGRDLEDDARKDRDFELRKQEAGKGAELRMVQLKQAKLSLDQLEKEAKIPPAVKTTVASLNKQIEVAGAALNAAILKGEADPAGIAAISKKVDDLTAQANKVIEPYMPKAEAGQAAKPQDVKVGGVVIGQAGTPEEAQKLVQEHLAAKKKPADPAPPEKRAAPDSKYPHMGYSTIDGAIKAARGNPALREYLRGLSSGDLSAAQRQRISELPN